MYAEDVVDVEVGGDDQLDVPAVKECQALHTRAFTPEIASGVDDCRTAAGLVGQEVAVGVVGIETFRVYLHGGIIWGKDTDFKLTFFVPEE